MSATDEEVTDYEAPGTNVEIGKAGKTPLAFSSFPDINSFSFAAQIILVPMVAKFEVWTTIGQARKRPFSRVAATAAA